MTQASAQLSITDYIEKEESTEKLSPMINDFKSLKNLTLANESTSSEQELILKETSKEKINDTLATISEFPSRTRKFWYEQKASFNENFISLQKWEGHVIDIKRNTFWARLFDLLNDHIVEEAEFSKEEIDNQDKDLLKLGAIFIWSVGYLDRPSGRNRTSIIRFRRLPAWSRSELEKARIEGVEFKDILSHEKSK